jgi:predicted ATPase with chaperone activity
MQDEMLEITRKTLEVLGQPLEEGSVTISRALCSTTIPPELILVAAVNPCPCGQRSPCCKYIYGRRLQQSQNYRAGEMQKTLRNLR